MNLTLASLSAVILAACGGGDGATSSGSDSATGGVLPVANSAPSVAAMPAQTPNSSGQTGSMPERAATRVRFAVGDAEIIVRIADNPTSRDFVSMLPLTLDFEDFASMEKLSYLPRRLITEGSTGSAPSNGELIYFVPWGNLGFFYNAERRDRSFDDRVIAIGTVESGYERLSDLETGPVSVEVIR